MDIIKFWQKFSKMFSLLFEVLGNNENAEKIRGETKVNSREKTRIHTPINRCTWEH